LASPCSRSTRPLIYGFGLGLLANMLPKQRQHGGDWRTAGS
jgi:hypothetical protein